MARFFFHLYDDTVALDEEGSECPDLAAAHAKAVRSAREMACQEVLEGHLNLTHRIDVADENGAVLATVRFQDIVKLKA